MHNYILQIDTATEICSVSISSEGITIAKVEAAEPNLHAAQLTVFIEELLLSSNIHYSDLSAVCVSKGPGSYTGLRIGVSTAKGLCYALDIPLLAINTLDMMFRGYMSADKGNITDLYVPMLDARRMEVYLEVFDKNGLLLVPTEARIIDVNSFDAYQGKNIVLFGTGAAKLTSLFHDESDVLIDANFIHSSSYMSAEAYEKFNKNEVEDLVYFEPYYLKEFIALLPKKVIG